MGIPQSVRIPTRWNNFDKNIFFFIFSFSFSKMFPSLVINFCLIMAISGIIGVIGVIGGPATDESVREAENNKTFVYVQQKMNWADARNECKKRGGDLASLINPKDFDRMYTEIGENRDWIWVGGNNKDGSIAEDNAWLTGEPIPSSYQYWCDREPLIFPYRCLVTLNDPIHIKRKNGDAKPCLGKQACTRSKAFVCEIY